MKDINHYVKEANTPTEEYTASDEPPPPLPEECYAQQVEPGSEQDTKTTTLTVHGIKSGDWYKNNDSVCLHYVAIGAVTGKAVCLTVLDPSDNLVKDIWIPKKLLSNLDEDLCIVYVWDKFLIRDRPEMYYALMDAEG